MNRNWRICVIVIASLLCTIIVCLTVNISVGKITKGLSADGGTNNNQQAGGQLSVDGQDNTGGADVSGVTDANGAVAATDAAGNAITNSAGKVVTQSGGSSGGNASATQNNGVNPLNYSKSQIVSYYNSCLNKSYSQSKMNAEKSEKVTVTFSEEGILVNGEKKSGITSIAEMIVKANAKDTNTSKSFTSGKASDGTAASTFVLPAGLSASGVQSATVSKSGSGYKVVMTLVKESCDFTTMPPHNKSCAYPLNFNDIDFKGYAEITSATFNYPGTKLTATIDSSGRVSYVQVNMPLSVSNASGTILKVFKGTTITVSGLSGEWVCKVSMTF